MDSGDRIAKGFDLCSCLFKGGSGRLTDGGEWPISSSGHLLCSLGLPLRLTFIYRLELKWLDLKRKVVFPPLPPLPFPYPQRGWKRIKAEVK